MNDIELNGDLPELNVDPETGEILGFETDIVVDDLPKLARGLRYRQAEINRLANYRDKEVNRIVESCEHKINRLSEQMGFIENRARDMMKAAGQDNLDYPGLGKFRFGLTRVKVDDTAYYAMSDVERDLLRTEDPMAFTVKRTVSPKKAFILNCLKDAHDVPGFCLTEQEETFTFKPEN